MYEENAPGNSVQKEGCDCIKQIALVWKLCLNRMWIMNDPEGSTMAYREPRSNDSGATYLWYPAAKLSSIYKSANIRNPPFFLSADPDQMPSRVENTIHFRERNKLIFRASASLHSLDTLFPWLNWGIKPRSFLIRLLLL